VFVVSNALFGGLCVYDIFPFVYFNKTSKIKHEKEETIQSKTATKKVNRKSNYSRIIEKK